MRVKLVPCLQIPSGKQTSYSFIDCPQLRKASGKVSVNPLIFDSIAPVKVAIVQDDLDGIYVYEVLLQQSLQSYKGGRAWGNAKSSKSVSFTDSPRSLLSCKGSYVCQNKSCLNFSDFGINRKDFTQ